MKRKTYDISFPPEQFTDPEARVLWRDAPESFRLYVRRRFDEQTAGIAIYKDRQFGRPDRCEGGFHALQMAENELYAARMKGQPTALHHQRAVDDLRSKLKPDIDWLATVEQLEAHGDEHAAAQGMTLMQWFLRQIELEELLERDLVGFCFEKLADLQIDPLQFFRAALRQPHPVH